MFFKAFDPWSRKRLIWSWNGRDCQGARYRFRCGHYHRSSCRLMLNQHLIIACVPRNPLPLCQTSEAVCFTTHFNNDVRITLCSPWYWCRFYPSEPTPKAAPNFEILAELHFKTSKAWVQIFMLWKGFFLRRKKPICRRLPPQYEDKLVEFQKMFYQLQAAS